MSAGTFLLTALGYGTGALFCSYGLLGFATAIRASWRDENPWPTFNAAALMFVSGFVLVAVTRWLTGV